VFTKCIYSTTQTLLLQNKFTVFSVLFRESFFFAITIFCFSLSVGLKICNYFNTNISRNTLNNRRFPVLGFPSCSWTKFRCTSSWNYTKFINIAISLISCFRVVWLWESFHVHYCISFSLFSKNTKNSHKRKFSNTGFVCYLFNRSV